MNLNATIQLISVAAIPLIFAITLHEAAHGWVASKLGDRTALMLGRVTLNPVKHIDLFGTIFIPFITLLFGGVIFGWAKPVPVAWQNLKNPRRDSAIVALAGPAANLFMALVWAAIGKAAGLSFSTSFTAQPMVNDVTSYLHYAALYGIMINIVLMVLNLIPLPPLDGSRVISSLLPSRLEFAYSRIEPYGIWILLALLVTGILKYILWPPMVIMIHLIRSLFGL